MCYEFYLLPSTPKLPRNRFQLDSSTISALYFDKRQFFCGFFYVKTISNCKFSSAYLWVHAQTPPLRYGVSDSIFPDNRELELGNAVLS